MMIKFLDGHILHILFLHCIILLIVIILIILLINNKFNKIINNSWSVRQESYISFFILVLSAILFTYAIEYTFLFYSINLKQFLDWSFDFIDIEKCKNTICSLLKLPSENFSILLSNIWNSDNMLELIINLFNSDSVEHNTNIESSQSINTGIEHGNSNLNPDNSETGSNDNETEELGNDHSVELRNIINGLEKVNNILEELIENKPWMEETLGQVDETVIKRSADKIDEIWYEVNWEAEIIRDDDDRELKKDDILEVEREIQIVTWTNERLSNHMSDPNTKCEDPDGNNIINCTEKIIYNTYDALHFGDVSDDNVSDDNFSNEDVSDLDEK